MRVERGLRRVTWLVTLLVGLAAAYTVYLASLEPDLTLAILHNRPLRAETRWVAVMNGLFVGALAAAIPWVVFFVGRWVVRGFQEDR